MANTNSLDFNGSSAYVGVGNSSVFNVTSSATWFGWIYPRTFGSNNWIFGKDLSGARSYAVGLSASGTILINKNGGQVTAGTGTAFSVNTWQHYILTYDNSNWIMYINNVSAATVANTGAITTTTTNVDIGRRPFVGSNGYFNIIMCQMGMASTAISSAERTALYSSETLPASTIGYWSFNEGTGAIASDTSGNGNNGTITSATWGKNVPARTNIGAMFALF